MFFGKSKMKQTINDLQARLANKHIAESMLRDKLKCCDDEVRRLRDTVGALQNVLNIDSEDVSRYVTMSTRHSELSEELRQLKIKHTKLNEDYYSLSSALSRANDRVAVKDKRITVLCNALKGAVELTE